MTRTITRLFDSRAEAIAAVEDLESEGVDPSTISLVANDRHDLNDERHRSRGADHDHGHDHQHDGGNDVAEGAGKGAATGGLIGGGAGLLAGLGMLAIPGLGPVVAAGWLASTAVGALVGAAAGGATGGILGALKDAGHSDDEANVYSEGVRRGGTLVSVKTEEDHLSEIRAILDHHGGVDAQVRGEAYRQSGWTRFDAEAAPYSADDILQERALYRTEERSFTDSDPDHDPALDPDDRLNPSNDFRPGQGRTAP